MSEGERRLVAIMFTDMVGYTALGQRNESLSLALVEEQRKIIRPILARHNGREVKTMGDAFLVEFSNVVDAVRCAYDIQRGIREFNLSLASEKRIHLRIGIHLGEVVEFQGDLSGDAVNVASRIEALAEGGGVCLTRQVYDHVRNKLDFQLSSLGMKTLKNVDSPVEIFKVEMPWEEATSRAATNLDLKRIAVLPFASMSPDPNDAFFADGITEEVISTLSNISGLHVISRTSVMGFKGATKKLKDIGHELEVGSVLEGSLRKAGNRVRVTAQLISVSNDQHLWAESYDRELDDIFAVQTDIARQVAEALRVRILSSEVDRIGRKPTSSTKAHTMYLTGRFHWNRRDVDSMRKAQEYFRLAVKEDPDFALGYVGLADCHFLLASNFRLDFEENLRQGRVLVARALELEPDLAEAHASRGGILQTNFEFAEAEKEFKRAIELKPSYASAHQWYSMLLSFQSRWDEAFQEIQLAAELDPLSPIINAVLSDYLLYHQKEGDKALELAKRGLELNPGQPFPHYRAAIKYGEMKMFEEARREMDIALELSRESYPHFKSLADVTIAYFEGEKPTVRRLLPQLEAHLGGMMGVQAVEIAGFYFWLGDDEKGFEWLERSLAQKELRLAMLRQDERFGTVRNDPRFLDVFSRMGLA
ncbi:MAG: adenylate/guanylate cyclase domain-containing protein [Thaumarchaeota archaeon]|nr:adenylate/guanylate cyclase domain-containing protein [Nitrososphaerota archaeon]